MQPIKGINADVRPIEQPDGTYPFGKNGVQYDLKGAIINEPGFKKLEAAAPYQINGIIETDSKPLIFSTDDTNSAIGYFNPVTELYEAIFNDVDEDYKLGFKKANYITGQAQRNYKSEMVCAFTDKNDFPKYFNADALDVTQLSDWNLFPFYKEATIETEVIVGGRLDKGTYYVAMKYQRKDGTTSAYSSVSLGKTIANADASSFTDKAIDITISNADPSYDYAVLAIISKIKGVTQAVELVDPIPLNSGGDTFFTYTGDNMTTEIDIAEVLVNPIVYNRVRTMGQLNDSLYIGGLEKVPEIDDMQPYAGVVKVEWVSQLINTLSPPAEHISGEIKGMMHEEVYALYIRYRLKNGLGKSKCFTIPGRYLLAAELLDSAQGTVGGITAPVFQVEDTIDAFDAGTFSGNTGAWQNSTEKYPDHDVSDDFDSSDPAIGGIDNSGLFVRHHKMPSIRWCKENLYSTEDEYGKTKLDILGLRVSNIIIPDKYADIIDGYEILYAKRNVSNMTNYGQGLLLHAAAPRRDLALATQDAELYPPGQNWDTIIKYHSPSSYDDTNDLFLRIDSMRFHAFDILANKPGIKPNFISAQLKHTRTGLRATSLYQDGQDSGGNNTSTVHLIDYMSGAGSVDMPYTYYIRGIKDGGTYLNINTNIGKMINNHHETCFGGYLLGGDFPLTWEITGFHLATADGTPYDSDILGDRSESYLINLKSVKADIYQNFYSQALVAAVSPRDLTDLSEFYGGDTFVCPYTFHTYGRHEMSDVWAGYVEKNYCGKKVINRFICETTNNLYLRFEIPGNIYSKWFPNTFLGSGDDGVAYPEYWDRNMDPNQFGYDKDLSALNDLVSTQIFNPYQEDINTFPYRIHRGGKISRQSKFRSWRTFIPLDYYECQKNVGLITNLEGMMDRLFIHHENALFQTQNKATMDTSGIKVTLGSGDIFQFEPQEVQPAKLGYAGSQHDLACVRTPMGYVFPDAKQGELFLMAGDKLMNLNPGLNRILLKYLKMPDVNSYNGNGITIGWDQKYKRILLTVKSIAGEVDSSFTMSYSIESQSWVFFHDYAPDHYFHTREQLWSVKDQFFYKHNADVPGKFYDLSVNSFFIDIVFRSDSDMILESLSWITEIIAGNVDNSDNESEWSTLTHISIWNSQQHTGRIVLKELFEGLEYETDRRTQGVWNFNDFRNIVAQRGTQFLMDVFHDYALIEATTDPNKEWYDKELIEDKYCVVRFEFDNLSGKQIILHDIKAQVLKSNR